MKTIIDNEYEIAIRRNAMCHKVGVVSFKNIEEIHWDNKSGGVGVTELQYRLFCYVWCNMITGEIDHTCKHGPPPHRIKVVILKSDNVEIYSKLKEIAGPNPRVSNAKPLRAKDIENIAQEIAKCVMERTDHFAIKKAKRVNKIYICPLEIDKISSACTVYTARKRSKKVKLAVQHILSDWRGGVETRHGFYLAYEYAD